eukprot:GHVS01033804.1.p1 GENE.GHVS01033804.1~~GHVS01033804.1.p1  ORF type:complete len:150 (+),score=21.25 GHVS01033804.1:516-965(+)
MTDVTVGSFLHFLFVVVACGGTRRFSSAAVVEVITQARHGQQTSDLPITNSTPHILKSSSLRFEGLYSRQTSSRGGDDITITCSHHLLLRQVLLTPPLGVPAPESPHVDVQHSLLDHTCQRLLQTLQQVSGRFQKVSEAGCTEVAAPSF